jgi:hypothetical protein
MAYQTPVPQNFLNQSDSYYRILSAPSYEDGYPAYRDFQKTGTIRGSDVFAEQAYFNKGYPDPQYYAQTTNKNYDLMLKNWGKNSLPSNYVMEINPYFMDRISAGNNPLYQTNALSPTGGSYHTLTPDNVQPFIDRVNPLNRRGIKVTHFTGSEMSQPMAAAGETLPPAQWSRNPNASVLYDTTKPFTKTSFGQHARNAIFEAGTFLEQPEVGNLARKVNTFGNYAGIVPLVTSELERKRSDYQNPVTQEYFTKDKVTELDGITYDSATPKQIAMFHPDNADEHPEITDEMRKKFYPKWFK